MASKQGRDGAEVNAEYIFPRHAPSEKGVSAIAAKDSGFGYMAGHMVEAEGGPASATLWNNSSGI